MRPLVLSAPKGIAKALASFSRKLEVEADAIASGCVEMAIDHGFPAAEMLVIPQCHSAAAYSIPSNASFEAFRSISGPNS